MASWLTAAQPALLEQIRKEADMEMAAPPGTSRRITVQHSTILPQPLALPAGFSFGRKWSAPCRWSSSSSNLTSTNLPPLLGAKNTMARNGKNSKPVRCRLEKMKRAVLKEGWLKPQAVYGFFPASGWRFPYYIFPLPQRSARVRMSWLVLISAPAL